MKQRHLFPVWMALLVAMLAVAACSARSAADQANAQSTGTAQAVINANAWGTQQVLDRVGTSAAVMTNIARLPSKPNQSNSAPRETPRPTREPIVLQIYLLDFTEETMAWMEEDIKHAFEEAHPGVTVEYIWGSWEFQSDLISPWLAVGEGPDIVNLSAADNANLGWGMEALTDELTQWQYLSAFIPGTLDAVTWEGEIRGLPLFVEPRTVMCRTDLMEAAGYTSQPTDFAEWVQFAQDATIIDPQTNAIKQMGFNVLDLNSAVDFQWYLNTFFSLGGELYKPDGTPNFDSPEATAALKFNYDLMRAVWVDETIGGTPYTAHIVETGNDFGACLWHSPWGAPPLDDPVWEMIDIQPFPGDPTNFPNSRPISLADVHWLAVPWYSTNRELAVEFLKFVSSAENNYRWNETLGLIPARQDAHYGFVTDDPVLARQAELAVDYTHPYAGIREPMRLQEILQLELGRYLTDQQDLATTQRNIQEKYTEVLQPAEP